jgi:hypothetical protein
MAVPITPHKFVYLARLLAEAVHTYIRQFGQLALLPFLPCRNFVPYFFSSHVSQAIAFFLHFLLS